MNDEATDNDRPVLLIVDDDEVYCSVLANALQKRGYRVCTAYDLAGALEQARSHEPEYAVVDLRIGTESGLELVKQLAELDETRVARRHWFREIRRHHLDRWEDFFGHI